MGIPRPAGALLLVAGLLALVGALVGLYLTQSGLQHRLRADARQLAQLVSELTSGKLTLKRPRGALLACASSSSAASISDRIRRLRSRNSMPSAVNVTLRVLR